MSYPSPGIPVTVPYFFYKFDGSDITRVDVAGTLQIQTITTFTWGQVETSWRLATVSVAPPVPPGGPWFGGDANTQNAERYRADSGLWVPRTGIVGGGVVEWTSTGAQGPTGAFQITYPDTLVNAWSFLYTYNDPALRYEIWPPGVVPPGVSRESPVRFTAKPMASAKGALQTIIDGGGP